MGPAEQPGMSALDVDELPRGPEGGPDHVPRLQSEADGGVIEHRPADDAAFLFYFHNGVTPSVESLVSRGTPGAALIGPIPGQKNFSRPQTSQRNTAIFMLPDSRWSRSPPKKVCSPS